MSGESTITNSLLFEREKGQVGPKSPRVNYPDHQLAIFYKKKITLLNLEDHISHKYI